MSDDEDHSDLDQYRQHSDFWKGFRAAIRGYASESEEEDDYDSQTDGEQTEAETEAEDEEGEEEDKDEDQQVQDERQDQVERQDDGRPYSRSRTPRCRSRCNYYPCGPYRAPESDYDSDAESDYD